MKVNMLDGTTIDATPTEYKEMLELGLINSIPQNVAPQQQKKEPETLIPSNSGFKRYWSEEEDDLIIDAYKHSKIPGYLSPKERDVLHKKLSHRTHDAIKTRAKVLKSLTKKPNYGFRKGEVETVVVVNATPVKKKVREKRQKNQLQLTAEQHKQLVDNLHLNCEAIAKKMGLEYNRLYHYIHTLGGLRKLRKNYKIKGPAHKGLFTDEHRARMTFISSRGNALMKLHNWSREKAFRYASDEWNAKGKKQVPVKNSIFPKFSCLTDQGQKILIDITKNIIDKKGTFAYNESYCLERKDGDWNIPRWKNFCTEFITHSNLIAEYFGVEDKFRIKQSSFGGYNLSYN